MKRQLDNLRRSREHKRLKPTPLRSSVKKIVAKITESRQERKYVDNFAAVQDMTSSGTVVTLNEVAEGTDYMSRIGRKIRHKYLQYDIAATLSHADITLAYVVNWTAHLVLDRQPDAGAPAANIVFDTNVITDGAFAFKNVNLYERRFKVLKTFTGQFTQNSVLSDNRQRGFINLESMPEYDQVCHFGGTTAAVPTTNAIYLVWFSDEAGAGDTAFTYGIRYCYTDM